MLLKVLSALTFLSVSMAAQANITEQFEAVKSSVVNFVLKGAGEPSHCGIWKEMSAKRPLDKQTTAFMTGFCDSDIDVSKSVTFTEMAMKESEGHSYFCGTVSGETQLGSKIGARFIVFEPYHLVIGFKYSRRPIAFVNDDTFIRDEYHAQIASFNEKSKKYCE